MFTGIIESVGTITAVEREGTNIHFTIASDLSDELKIDQSLAHDGVCLTVVALASGTHTVTAVQETLNRSNLADWQPGRCVNLERAMPAGGRLDGHIVQGHVDTQGRVRAIDSVDGSWHFRFAYQQHPDRLLVDKGSICINGVSLTVISPQMGEGRHASDQDEEAIETSDGQEAEVIFGVAIIPYTYRHTNFKDLRPGDVVNMEFDIIGKYISKWASVYGLGGRV